MLSQHEAHSLVLPQQVREYTSLVLQAFCVSRHHLPHTGDVSHVTLTPRGRADLEVEVALHASLRVKVETDGSGFLVDQEGWTPDALETLC